MIKKSFRAYNTKDLKEGDNISITFTGLVQETSPAGIQEVLKVQLLDDDFEG